MPELFAGDAQRGELIKKEVTQKDPKPRGIKG